MTMQKMRAESRFKLKPNDERSLAPGEEFETDVDNAADLKAMGFATPLSGMGEALSRAAESAKLAIRRNTYRRRDLTAEKTEEATE